MRVAVTVFSTSPCPAGSGPEHVSPLFESARRLLLADIDGAEVQVLKEEAIGDLDLPHRLVLLARLGVRVLACGAINGFTQNALQERGIRVYPWVSGAIQDVLHILALRCATDASRRQIVVEKIAVPAVGADLRAALAPTLGRSSHLLVVESLGLGFTSTEVGDLVSGQWGNLRLTRMIVELGARVLLTGSCGPNAHGILGLAGVRVCEGVSGVVEDAVREYTRGSSRAVTTRRRE
jgi:predicted Fe-Mo cluster-binding NifX family protein